MSFSLPNAERLPTDVREAFDVLLAQLNAKIAVLVLTDGVAEPATEVGKTKIWVDVSSGDLMVKFGNGFSAVIRADS